MSRRAGRGVLITGSACGLGLELARVFAHAGDRVFLTDIAAALAAQTGQAVSAHVADLSADGAAAAVFERAKGHLGTVDVLINNAVIRKMSPVQALADSDWDRALEVNLSAPFRLIRMCLPDMQARNWGRIINMASVYSLIALAGRADYVTTKHAMIGLTRTVALELAATSVTCNAICPGLMATESALHRIEALACEKDISREAATRLFLSTRQPGGKFIPIETVTALALFLCGSASEGINGAAIPVDNGWSFA
jgi:3-hydroxybutyrate dehydrogenase